MEDQSLVRSARTVEEAIELATLELGVGRDEIEIDVISNGRSGILGIGAEDAKIRVRRIISGDGSASTALGVVERFLDWMDVDAVATIRSSGGGEEMPVIDLQGNDAGLLIGHRGETLRAFQFLVNITLGRAEGHSTGVILDVEQYRERRERQLSSLAQRMAQRAAAGGRAVELEPMSPADRRIIHATLADYTNVETQSEGEGADRRVVIIPTGARQSGGGRRGGRRS